jgi:hypothetical protein
MKLTCYALRVQKWTIIVGGQLVWQSVLFPSVTLHKSRSQTGSVGTNRRFFPLVLPLHRSVTAVNSVLDVFIKVVRGIVCRYRV